MEALDPRSRRALVVVPVVVAMLAMIGPFSIDTPFPAFAEMARDLGVDSAQMQLVVTSYLAPYAVMSIFHGPLSDAVGRKPVLVGSLAAYAAASIGAVFAPSLEVLLLWRALQGVSAGGFTIVSRTIVRDLFEGAQAQVLMSRVAMIFGLAPAVAPVVGGGVLQVGDWTWVFWFMAVLGLGMVVVTALVLPESHPPEARVPLRPRHVVGGLVAVVRRADFHRLAWAATAAFAAQFLYIGGAAIYVVDVLGQGELDFWKLFVPMIGLMIVGSWISGRAAGRTTGRRLVSAGFAVAVLGSAVGLALALSPVGERLPYAVVGCSLIALGNGMAYPTLQLMLLDLAPGHRGSVASAGMAVTLLTNAALAVLVAPYAASVLGFALGATTLVVVGMLLWSWHCAVERRAAAITAPAA